MNAKPIDEEMTDTEMWRALKGHRRGTHTYNRENGADVLKRCEVIFEYKNGGAHLIVRHAGKVIDYWPGTGRWIDRAGNGKKFGLESLAKYIGIDLRWKRNKEDTKT